MTGRELIIYILKNDLENEEVFGDGSLLGFMTVSQAAVKYNVGVCTVIAWAIEFNILDHIKIGNQIFIPSNAKSPIEEQRDYAKP